MAGTTPSPTPADDAALLERARGEMDQIDAALRRLDDGSYGRCEVCSQPLDAAELEADPLLVRCASHTR
ncbi:MAG: TraR/DksA family transcriptional regulator [Acidimicrobiales bacterium]